MDNFSSNPLSSDLSFELQFALRLCKIVNSEKAFMVRRLIESEDYDQLASLDIDPSTYQDPQRFAEDYLVTKILSKSVNLPTTFDRKQAAIDSFYESESRCSETKRRLTSAETSHPIEARIFGKRLRGIMGRLDRSDLSFVEDRFRFGPGATTGVRGVGGVMSDKYDEEIHLTYGLYPFYRSILGGVTSSTRDHVMTPRQLSYGKHPKGTLLAPPVISGTWWDDNKRPIIVPGNKFATVNKNAKTDRGMCPEPTLNIYLQLGIGALLRKRLHASGCNLNTQEWNQWLASKAQEFRLATIDLSQASDSTARELVYQYASDRWAGLLDLGRSPRTYIEGDWVELEKFSSMGNGFTFELESAVFLAAVQTVVPRTEWCYTAVYGDDIIVPQEYAHRLIDLLAFLGFKTNGTKSFLAGNFFESCGTDWFYGHNVRPFYLNQEEGNPIPYPLHVANSLRLWSSRVNGNQFCDDRFKPLWRWCLRQIPKPWNQTSVPAELGDSGVLKSFEEARLLVKSSPDQHEGVITSHIVFTPKRKRKRTLGVLLNGLTSLNSGYQNTGVPIEVLIQKGIYPPEILDFNPNRPTVGREPVRGYLGKLRKGSVLVSTWTDGLSWETLE